MAVVQYTGVVNQLRGRLNGSVFNKSRNAYTLGRKQAPPSGWRGRQLGKRTAFSVLQRQWKDLDSTTKNLWQTTANENPSIDRFGQQTILSGYNQYIKARILAESSESPVLPAGYPTAAPAAEITSLVVDFMYWSIATSGNVQLNGAVNYDGVVSGDGFRYILDVSVPQSKGVTVYHKGWRLLVGGELDSTGFIQFQTDMGNRYPIPQSPQFLWVRLRLLHVDSGQIVATYSIPYEFGGTYVITGVEMTPTTYANPQTFTVHYADGRTGNTDRYITRVFSEQDTGSCPPVSTSSAQQAGMTSQLESSNVAVLTNAMPSNSCQSWLFAVYDNVEDSYVSQFIVHRSRL